MPDGSRPVAHRERARTLRCHLFFVCSYASLQESQRVVRDPLELARGLEALGAADDEEEEEDLEEIESVDGRRSARMQTR